MHGIRVKLIVLYVATLALPALTWNALAQSSWTNSAGGNWSVADNWIGGAPPSGGSDTTVLNFTTAGAFGSVNDLPGIFQLNQFAVSGPTLSLSGNNVKLCGSNPQLIQGGAGQLTIAMSVELATNTILGGSGGGNVTFAGLMTGSGGLTKTTSSTLTLGGIAAVGINSFSGGVSVGAGTLVLNTNRFNLGSGPITLAGGSTFYTLNFEGNGAGGAITNTFNLSGGVVTVWTSKDIWITGPVTGQGGLLVSGSGKMQGLTLSGAKTFTGGVKLSPIIQATPTVSIDTINSLGTGPLRSEITSSDVSAGNLRAFAAVTNSPGVTNTIDLASGCRLVVNADGANALWLSGVITNAGSLVKIGTAALTLSGVNTFSGNTTLNGGSLVLGNSLAAQNSTCILNSTNSTMVFARGLTAFTLGGLAGNAALALTNADGSPVVLSVGNNNSSTTFSNVLSGAGSLTKIGAGTLTLSGSNTYSGVTTVTGGILRLTNSPSILGPNTDVVLSSGSGTLNLAFTGTNLVNAIFTNGTRLAVGAYGANGSTITGSGFLRVATSTPSSRKDMLSFTFPSLGTAAISGTNISLTVPYGTGVTNLAPTFTVSLLASANPVSGTMTNFTSPVAYSVTAEDGSIQVYRVAVSVTPASTNKDILAFTLGANAAVIAGTNITLTLPYGTAVTNLAPTYTTSLFATGVPMSGTNLDFMGPQTYTVTAQDGSAKAYRAIATITPASTNKDILSFSFGALGTATISGTNITMTVPVNQAVTNLAPTFTLSPFATANPPSGVTNDFTTPQTYTVTAQNGSTKRYLVTVQNYQAWQHSASFYILTTPEGANLPGSAVETGYPVLMRLNKTFFDFSQAKALGADLRFSTSAGVPAAYQIEQWDAVKGSAAIWVSVPMIAGNVRQEMKMYWGNADAASESSGPAVFNGGNGFLTVFHMNEALVDEIGTLNPADTGTLVSDGMVGKGRTFPMGKGINCGEAITKYPTGNSPASTEAWFRATRGPAEIVDWGTEGGGNKVQIRLSSPPQIYVDGNGPSVTGASSLRFAEWFHVAHTYTSGDARIYVNGQVDGSSSATMTFANPSKMWLGGWYNTYSFVGDMDEVRVSKVSRSANWIKMDYENQKALQTLVGPLVQPGSNFSVATSSLTMLEGGTTNLVAQAGGAQKLYWIYKKDGQETVIAVDRYNIDFSPARVTGGQSFVLQFKAIYPSGILTSDVPVTVEEYLPDPDFTLVPSTNQWDGRQTMTVTPSISNWSEMQGRGVTNLNYSWSVAGLAVSTQNTNGTLSLLRSQGSGVLAVTLILDNGGALVTRTITVPVQEPANEAWVVRTPATNEIPVTGQFYARDDTGYGTIYYNGALAGSPDSVILKVYTNGTFSAAYSQTLSNGTYAFTARIAGGLVNYSVQFGSITSGATNVLNTVTNLVCGDAYVVEGQSNAVADNNDKNPTNYPAVTFYTNSWIRSYGQLGGWGLAACSSSTNSSGPRIGYWAMGIASNLVATYGIPICIINGAVGGTPIYQHQPNPTNHYDTVTAGYTIYGNLLTRVAAAKLTHGIRGVLWHQGENDSGSGAPTGDYNYKSYQQYFVDMSMAWKQDMPNIKYYYVYQIFPAPCSMGVNVVGDMVREVQRTLPKLYSNMSVMETIGGPNYGKTMCHWGIDGYTVMASNMTPLVARDNYGLVPATVITAPDLKRAYFTSTNQNEIALEFGQDMTWNSAATVNFFLDHVGGKVISGSSSGKVVTLELSQDSTNQSIDYVSAQNWNADTSNLLYGANGLAALTFATVSIESATVTNDAFAVWLSAYRLTNGTSGALSQVDSDGDGMLNWQEWVAGTNPTNAASLLSITNVVMTADGTMPLIFTSVTGKSYQVWQISDLLGTNWSVAYRAAFEGGPYDTNVIPGTGSAITNFVQPGGSSGFYRIGVQ